MIEAKNLADNLVYTTEKTLRDSGGKVSADIKKEIEEKVEALKKVKESGNIEEIKQKSSDLSQTVQKIGAEMYKAAEQEKKAGQEQEKEGHSSPDAQEAEAKEKEEEKEEEEKQGEEPKKDEGEEKK